MISACEQAAVTDEVLDWYDDVAFEVVDEEVLAPSPGLGPHGGPPGPLPRDLEATSHVFAVRGS